MIPQREYSPPHHKPRMRKSYIIVLVSLVALLTLAVSVVGVDPLANKFLLYVRVARLHTQDPPTNIVMPLQVSKKQIANTWHAPRGANRLHEGQDIFAPAAHRHIQPPEDISTILDKTGWEDRLFL